MTFRVLVRRIGSDLGRCLSDNPVFHPLRIGKETAKLNVEGFHDVRKPVYFRLRTGNNGTNKTSNWSPKTLTNS